MLEKILCEYEFCHKGFGNEKAQQLCLIYHELKSVFFPTLGWMYSWQIFYSRIAWFFPPSACEQMQNYPSIQMIGMFLHPYIPRLQHTCQWVAGNTILIFNFMPYWLFRKVMWSLFSPLTVITNHVRLDVGTSLEIQNCALPC